MHEVEAFVAQGRSPAEFPEDTGVLHFGQACRGQRAFGIQRGNHFEEAVSFVGILGMTPAFDAGRGEILVVLGRIVPAVEEILHIVKGDAESGGVVPC